MTDETERNDGTEPNEAADLREFEAGQRVSDREDDDSQILVLGPKDKTAEECYIEAIGQTVAEANPEYPASDPVADVAFIEGIEDSMGIGWKADEVLELYSYGELDRARIKAYGYPESRLAPAENDVEEKLPTGEPGCYECGGPLREGIVSDGERNRVLCFDCAEPNPIVNSDELPDLEEQEETDV